MQYGTAKMIQGVREVFEIVDMECEGKSGKVGKAEGKMVLIGRGLNAGAFGESLGLILGSGKGEQRMDLI